MATPSVNAQCFENPVGALRYAVRPEPSSSFAWTHARFSECSDTVIRAAVNLRGLMTSLGAGGSLIAAALCAAVLVGGILAVRGAVDDAAEANTGDVTVPGGRTAAAQTSTPGPPAAGNAAPAVAERRATPRRRARTQRQRGTIPVAPSPASEAPPTDDRSGTTGEGAGGGSGPPATGEQHEYAVTRVVRQTREAVAPVVEAAPEPVRAPVVDVVEDVGAIVDETLAPVTGLLEREL